MDNQLESPYIVVIEDDLDIAEGLQSILGDNGYRVSVISTESEIDQLSINDIPDLFLLDIWISGSDGRDMAYQLKSDNRLKDVPIIVLSANLSAPQIAKEIKADDFVLKPFDVDHLLSVISKRIRK